MREGNHRPCDGSELKICKFTNDSLRTRVDSCLKRAKSYKQTIHDPMVEVGEIGSKISFKIFLFILMNFCTSNLTFS